MTNSILMSICQSCLCLFVFGCQSHESGWNGLEVTEHDGATYRTQKAMNRYHQQVQFSLRKCWGKDGQCPTSNIGPHQQPHCKRTPHQAYLHYPTTLS